MEKGKIFIISGPSGSGKNTIIEHLLVDEELMLDKGVTHTSRKKREAEEHGKDHYFVSCEEFKQLLDDGEIVEYNFYNQNFYGTPKSTLQKAIKEKKNLIFEVDVNGAMKIKEYFPESKLIFLRCDIHMLEGRLRARNVHTEEDIKERMETYLKELEYLEKYDLVVDNHDGLLEETVKMIKGYIKKF